MGHQEHCGEWMRASGCNEVMAALRRAADIERVS